MEQFFSAAEARAVRPLPSLIPRCDHCKLDRACQSPKMKVDGEGRKGILIVGEYPGAEEDRQGKPLVGGTGKYLEDELRRVGVDMRRDCWLTNAQLCYDVNGTHPKSVIEDCRPNLLRTLRELNPTAILPMGGAAIISVVGHLWKPDIGTPGMWTGQRIPCQKPNAWVCPSYNPAYLLRQKKDQVLVDDFRQHLRDAVELARSGRPWPDGPPDYAGQVESIHDPDEAARRLERYHHGASGSSHNYIAFDFETTTLKPDGPHAEIVSCSVCWNGLETIAYPWHGATIQATRWLLEDREVGKIGSNIKFESRWALARVDCTVRGWAWDCMLAAHALDPRRGVTGLKFQAFTRLGQPDYNHHIEPFLDSGKDAGCNAPNRIKEIGLGLILKYNGLDSLLEYCVAEHQMAEMGLSL